MGDGGVTTSRSLSVGSLNVHGCGVDKMKREVIGRMFVRHRLDVFAVSETRMKGKGEGERVWCGWS